MVDMELEAPLLAADKAQCLVCALVPVSLQNSPAPCLPPLGLVEVHADIVA